MTAAALALLTTAAHADDDVSVAKGMMITSLYSRDCEKIPGIEQLIKHMLEQIPASAMKAGMAQAVDVYRSMTTIKFCSLYKDDIDRMRH
jgi:hypothetical protein